MPKNVKNQCKLYADDFKLIGIFKEEKDIEQIQIDVNVLQKWAKTWQMSFNYDKCKVMHFGKRNSMHEYTMNIGQNEPLHKIERTLVERDLGVMLSNDLKWASQTEKATNAAKGIIAQLKNSFSYFDAELVRLLYVSLIRPHLEYAVPVWNPHLKKDIDELENIQHRATRLCPGNKKKTYEDRLKIMRLTTLVTRKKEAI